MDYLANRPRVERIGAHGLFSYEGESVVLSRVQLQFFTIHLKMSSIVFKYWFPYGHGLLNTTPL